VEFGNYPDPDPDPVSAELRPRVKNGCADLRMSQRIALWWSWNLLV